MDASIWPRPLGEFQESVAAPQPMPAGVATAAATAALGLSLLMKALRIKGVRADLLGPAQELINELRETADADVAAVQAYIQNRDGSGMQTVPARAAHAVAQALNLCVEAEPSVTGLIAADVRAAAALLDGAANAIAACIGANAAGRVNP
jgi:hypothetical protein